MIRIVKEVQGLNPSFAGAQHVYGYLLTSLSSVIWSFLQTSNLNFYFCHCRGCIQSKSEEAALKRGGKSGRNKVCRQHQEHLTRVNDYNYELVYNHKKPLVCIWASVGSPPSRITGARAIYIYIYTTVSVTLTVNSPYFMFRARAQSPTTCSSLAAMYTARRPLSRPHWRDVYHGNDNIPAIIAPGRVPSKGRSACLGVVPLSNYAVGTDMLLKPLREEWSACPGIVAFNNMKRLLRRVEYNQWDHSRSPKMLSIPLVSEYVGLLVSLNQSLSINCCCSCIVDARYTRNL